MALKGAEIFGPMQVNEMTQAATMLQADQLQRFGFPEFTDAFIAGLKEEILRYRRMARAIFDWNSLEGAEEYEKQRRRRLEAREHYPTLRAPEYKKWEDATTQPNVHVGSGFGGAYVCSYEVQESRTSIHSICFTFSCTCTDFLRHVELSVVSHSSLKLRDNVLESTLECRLFERCGSTGFALHVELH
jgi:hypothetical protein